LKKFFPEIRSLRDVGSGMVFSEKRHLRDVLFRRCQFVVEENKRVHFACDALKNNNLKLFGELLCQSHEGLRRLYEVTCPETDFLTENARRDPAVLGARQVGGGFGGCTLNLVRRDAVADFQERIKAAYREKWGKQLNFYAVEITNGVEAICSR